MVTLNKIYTKTGDDGTTALGSGERRQKHDLRIEAYGTVDETNSVVGIVRLHASKEMPVLDELLGRIQNDLFDLGADLATPDTGEELGYEPLRITDNQISALEDAIDQMNVELTPLKSFVLPGGTPLATHLHQARTVSRRAERLVAALSQKEKVNKQALQYLNRLSDLFFVASRYANLKGEGDVLWVAGKNR
ncbi:MULTISPECIES: cob(I)yrinic acid a,c-diamide adenosyltransferase [unclassified Pseudovibrio]|uniref:cob(I)yrinic acid a,c-diamide adenosyltransferase n=1 Tax=unclassified Pseudovibrio TaxID=2627060 RepID=UPI0007AE3937|nr:MULTISPECIES: cob(I)yrinic acid a,c-diamide adenosyltransferase [unclassified Pseudovibrio]KZK93774.1 Cob(I)yrinic acid a,c-diamide adenosyltransferase [Pseudovibrio sp. W74]KZL12097.1 Cob(I)yrinic acid a,c-diamide adenosyltransferase [Pseudovibrio sp. Ad14]